MIFTSQIHIEGEVMEQVNQAELLGEVINNTLTWEDNTKYLVNRANSRMRILHKLISFRVPVKDLIHIYLLFFQSILEQSCQVCHSSLTIENMQNLE